MALSDTDYVVRMTYSQSDVYPKPFSNVWYFKRISGSGLADVLLAAVASDFIPIYESILPDFVDTNISIEVESLFELDDIDAGVSTLNGIFTAVEGSPSFQAAGFQLVRSTRANKRHGSKRIGPLAESMTNGNAPTTAYLTALNGAANAFDGDAVDGSSRFRVSIPQSVLVPNGEGELGSHYEIQDIHPVADILFRHITTQNSRKGF